MSITKNKILSSDLNSFHTTKQNNKPSQHFNVANNINVNYPSIPTILQDNTIGENPYEDLKTRDIELVSSNDGIVRNCVSSPSNVENTDIEPNNDEEQKVIADSINFLKLIIKAYEDNPIFINKYVVCNENTLKKMIKLLTQCDLVEFDYLDPECTCFKDFKTRYINEIFIKKDGKKNNFKYSNVDDYNIIKSHKISLNIVLK